MNRRELVSGLLASIGAPVSPTSAAPAARSRAVAGYRVVCFTGWIIPIFDSALNSPVRKVVERLGALGIPAALRAPGDWEATLGELAANRAQVTLMGYSLGAASAINVANNLANSRLPVRSLVLLEATDPPEIMAPTHVTHFYATGSSARVVAGPGSKGVVRNIDVGDIDANLASEGHLSVARVEKVLDLITRTVISGA